VPSPSWRGSLGFSPRVCGSRSRSAVTQSLDPARPCKRATTGPLLFGGLAQPFAYFHHGEHTRRRLRALSAPRPGTDGTAAVGEFRVQGRLTAPPEVVACLGFNVEARAQSQAPRSKKEFPPNASRNGTPRPRAQPTVDAGGAAVHDTIGSTAGRARRRYGYLELCRRSFASSARNRLGARAHASDPVA
jgi:hypothetical protein